MKNLKIYSAAKKNKAKKIIKIAIFALATTITLTGCGLQSKREKNREYLESLRQNQVVSQVQETIEIEKIDNEINASKKLKEGEKEITSLNFNQQAKQEFNTYLDNINTYYEYEEYFNFEENLNNLSDIKKSTIERKTDLNMENLSYSKLKQIIINNNKQYLSNQTMNFYKNLDSNTLDKTIKVIVDTIKGMKNNEYFESEKILNTLENLKIFTDATPSNAFLNSENCLIVNESMIDILQKMHPNIDAFTNTITHETMHIMQKNSYTNDENLDINIGPAYKFNNTEVNSLSFTWMVEASAEMLTMNYLNTENVVYDNMINYQESINLSNSLNANFQPNRLSELTLKNDFNSLLKEFNSNNYETLKMMYALEIMQQNEKGFYKTYEKINGKELTGENQDALNYSLKSSVCETMTKNFYRGLNNISDNASLEDVFYLITVFENDLNIHLKYFNTDRYEYNKDFMNKYVEIQDNYFKVLSIYTNKSQQEIEDLFNSYCINGTTYKNYDLNFLNVSTKNYIEETKERVNYINDFSIRNYNKKFINTKLK